MEAPSKKGRKGRKGRPPLISSTERERLLSTKGLDSDRWALDQRFKEITLRSLNNGTYPFIMPNGKKPRTSLLVELGRWGDERAIRQVAANLEAASKKKQTNH